MYKGIPPQGDPTRQALASLGGYAWQLYASSLAWLRLPPEAKLYLEVAEDYAQVLRDSLQAVQAKNTAASITINSPDVLTAIDSYIDLARRNPPYQVSLLFLTTARIGRELRTEDRIDNGPVLAYWPLAAQGAEVAPLRAILQRAKLTKASLAFITQRDDEQLRRDLLTRIVWQAEQPDLASLRAELDAQMIIYGHQHWQLDPEEAERLASAMVQKVLETILAPGARCLTHVDLLRLDHQTNTTSLRKRTLEMLLQQLDVDLRARQAKLDELLAWSSALASEVDVAGHRRSGGSEDSDEIDALPSVLFPQFERGNELRLSAGLYVQRKEGHVLTKRINALLNPAAPSPISNQPAARVFIVKGEAGHGKTSLLWWLHQAYQARCEVQVLFLRAAWLGAQAGAIKISAQQLLQACELLQTQGKTPLILIDTVDLLVRSEEDAAILMQSTLLRMQEQGAIVVLTSRPQEAKRLQSPQVHVSPLTLSAYDDQELQEALIVYARFYYRRADQLDSLQTDQHFARIERAVAQGKPVKDICCIPLALRMLFEIYAPQRIPEEIHIFGLYQDYWRHRIEADIRALQGSAANHNGSNRARETMWISALMLMHGSVELAFDVIAQLFTQKNLPLAALDDLLHRGILQRGPGGTLSFFHQTFFEHAAARAMLTLVPSTGLALLSGRVAARPQDLFIKPILQNALLLAEILPQQRQPMQASFAQLITAFDIADKTVALYVYCHWSGGSHTNSKAMHERSEQVRHLLLHPDCDVTLQIEFLRFASNLAQSRSAELLPLLGPLWQSQLPSKRDILRRRKHILSLLTRLAWRWPQQVFDFLGAEQTYHYVFHKDNINDDICAIFLETVGNAWLQVQFDNALAASPLLPKLRQLLLRSLCAALMHPFRFSLAEQVAQFIARGSLDESAILLPQCAAKHAEWDSTIGDGKAQHFVKAYCQLWVRHWQSEMTQAQQTIPAMLRSLLAAAPMQSQATQSLHLMAVTQWLLTQSLFDISSALVDIQSWLAQQVPHKQHMLWVDALLGPVFRHCLQQGVMQDEIVLHLHQSLAYGLAQKAQGQGAYALGVATRLILNCALSPSQLAQVFAAPNQISALEWRSVRELARLLFPAQLAGVAGAVASYQEFILNMAADKAFLSTMQQQFMLEFDATGELPEPRIFIQMVRCSGDVPKLLLVATGLRQRMHLDASFAAALHEVVLSLLHSPSDPIRSGAIQSLPALVSEALLPLPNASQALAWLNSERVAKNYAHTAKWVARNIALDVAQAKALGITLRGRMLQLLAQGSADMLFLKEAYLEAFSSLVRRKLLAPSASLVQESLTLEQELLQWSISAPLTEKHLTLFGWTLAESAQQAPARALPLLQDLFTAAAIEQLGQGARRDLARHLRQPIRDMFAFGTPEIWLALVAMIKSIDHRLARAIVEAALEMRAQELAQELEELRLDGALHGDLRKLIFTWRHHHARADEGEGWWELGDDLDLLGVGG